MENEKKPFGFLILGALAGAALGAAYSDVMNRPLAVAAGSILGVFGGMAAERCYVGRLNRFDALLLGIIVLVLICLFIGPPPPAYRE